jgi:hypothetical protein
VRAIDFQSGLQGGQRTWRCEAPEPMRYKLHSTSRADSEGDQHHARCLDALPPADERSASETFEHKNIHMRPERHRAALQRRRTPRHALRKKLEKVPPEPPPPSQSTHVRLQRRRQSTMAHERTVAHGKCNTAYSRPRRRGRQTLMSRRTLRERQPTHAKANARKRENGTTRATAATDARSHTTMQRCHPHAHADAAAKRTRLDALSANASH